MNRMMKHIAVALPLAVLLPTPATLAQTTTIFTLFDKTVPLEDLKKMREAATPLYLADPPEIGALGSWSNEATGNFGTVELTRVFEWRGMDCRELRHIVKIKGVRDAMLVTVDRCRTPEGEWKVRY